MKNIYTGKFLSDCMYNLHARCSFFLKSLFLLIAFCFLSDIASLAADPHPGEKEVTPLVYDEIPVHVSVAGYTDFYLDAIYTKKKLLYINVEDLFRTLNIPCLSAQRGDVLSGFIENESQAYLIDYNTNKIKVGSKIINTKNALIREMGSVYMESSLFAEAFGITLPFNYRSLSITLKSNFELPVVKQMRIEKTRSNMSRLRGEVIADTLLHREYHLFRFGTMDWSVASSQTLSGSTYNNFGLGIGTELLYGEADIAINYYDQYKFDSRQLLYLWRWVDNDRRIIKQAQVGTISVNPISFINGPVIGAVIRNSPTTVRKATGYYTINEVTQPNWIVELYINNVMVDYTRADASGSFIFKVPVVYGYNTLKLRFYGPMGEERTEERTINVPYTIMPAREFEYGLTMGMVQDGSSSHYGKAEFNYGVSRILTIGGGMEYLSSISNGPFIPFANATFHPFTRLTINGEYAHGVRTRGLLDYYFMKDALLEIDYTRYVEGQLATRFNAPEERKVKLSLPFRFRKINGFVRLDFTQLVYSAFTYNQANVMLSSGYKRFSANLSTQINWVNQRTPYVSSDISLSYMLNNGFILRPSAQYNVSENRMINYRVAIEKNIRRGNISVSYERNILSDDNLVSLNFKYDLPFARTYVSANHSKGNVNLTEGAQGSLAFGSGNRKVLASSNSSMGKGGISLYPFLDLNRNGVFDKGEPMVKLSSVKIFGGKITFSDKDSIIRISDLNAFTSCMLEFRDNDLENIAWRFPKKRYQVLVDPNQFKRIDIPIIAVGEVSGMAFREIDNGMKGIGRIQVKIYDKNNRKLVAETLSESDGYIYYLGLAPGEYNARPDTVQLNSLGFKSDPQQISFNIKTLAQGDIVAGLDFVLRQDTDESPEPQNRVEEPEADFSGKEAKTSLASNLVGPAEQNTIGQTDIREDAPTEPLPEISEEVLIIKDTMAYIAGELLYKVQLLALRQPIRVMGYFVRLLNDVPGLTIEELEDEDGLYHYSSGAFRSVARAEEFLNLIEKSGWKECFIAVYKVGQRDEPIFRLKRLNALP